MPVKKPSATEKKPKSTKVVKPNKETKAKNNKAQSLKKGAKSIASKAKSTAKSQATNPKKRATHQPKAPLSKKTSSVSSRTTRTSKSPVSKAKQATQAAKSLKSPVKRRKSPKQAAQNLNAQFEAQIETQRQLLATISAKIDQLSLRFDEISQRPKLDIEQSSKQGELKAAREFFLNLFEHKFSSPSTKLLEKINQADYTHLLSWTKRLFNAENIDDLFEEAGEIQAV